MDVVACGDGDDDGGGNYLVAEPNGAYGLTRYVPNMQHPTPGVQLLRLGAYKLQRNQILSANLREAIGGYMVGVLPEWGSTRVKGKALRATYLQKALDKRREEEPWVQPPKHRALKIPTAKRTPPGHKLYASPGFTRDQDATTPA